MIDRKALDRLLKYAATFKVVAVTGPRQSGKTTLVKYAFKDKPYVSLEDPDTRLLALEDPRGFLNAYPQGAVLDEVQRTPDLFSYLQGIIDQNPEYGQFILTGSNNFLLNESISQSLAGRVAILELLPFSYEELKTDLSNLPMDTFGLDKLLVSGFYPPIYDGPVPFSDWLPQYIRTYIERDVRQIKNITNLLLFEKFLRLCAGRTGQELNYTSLSVETGVDVKTIQSWIGVLESSYIVFLLPPFYKNYNKTLVKRPKLYFFDTGLACSLLGIHSKSHLKNHPLKGALFETLVVAELIKFKMNTGLPVKYYYWRDKTGREIDLLFDYGKNIIPVEIKMSKTYQSYFLKHLKYWTSLTGEEQGAVLYTGDQKMHRSDGYSILPWDQYASMLE